MTQIPKHRRLLGEAIRSARKSVGFSQEKLAELAELHPNYIGEVKRGEKNVSVDVLVRISAAVKVPVSELLSGI